MKKKNIVLKIAIFIFAFSVETLYRKGRFLANYITMEISSNWIEIVQNNENANTSLHCIIHLSITFPIVGPTLPGCLTVIFSIFILNFFLNFDPKN